MTTPHPTRREADAWWESLTRAQQARLCLDRCPIGSETRFWPSDWWRSLPDERAVTIYQQENRG